MLLIGKHLQTKTDDKSKEKGQVSDRPSSKQTQNSPCCFDVMNPFAVSLRVRAKPSSLLLYYYNRNVF